MRLFLAFLRRDLNIQMSYRLSFAFQALQALPVVLMFYYLSRVVDAGGLSAPLKPYGGAYFPFVLMGIAFQNYLSTALFHFSASIREAQLSGTLEAVLAAPVGVPAFLAGTAAYGFVFSTIRIGLYIGFGMALMDLGISWRGAVSGLGVTALAVGAFASLGIFAGAFIVMFKKGEPVTWLFNALSWLMGGVYYPVDVLPEWLQRMAAFIPMTHALEAFRSCLIGGRPLSDAAGHLAVLALWTVLGLPAGCLCFQYALNRCREAGALGHY